jgi:hypothetical protein
MKKNVGKLDKTLRFLSGFILVLLTLLGWIHGWASNISLVLGAILLITASINFCPLYTLIRISTFKRKA